MAEEIDYEIVYTLHRRRPGEEDLVEIGFGSSGTWSTPEGCAHMVTSAIQNYEWETEAGMPAPDEVRAEVEADRG